jgi:hypothetical protein
MPLIECLNVDERKDHEGEGRKLKELGPGRLTASKKTEKWLLR